jgi:hypothetical protein
MAMDTEIEKLRRHCARNREELTATATGFFLGAMGFGYLAQWYFSTHGIALNNSMLPFLCMGCAGAGALMATSLVASSRLRIFVEWRRAENARLRTRLQDQ